MPTHFSKLEGSPSHRRKAQRRRRFDTPKLTITHDGCVSSTTNVWERNSPGVDESSIGQSSTNIPEFICVQNWRRLPQNEEPNEQQSRVPKNDRNYTAEIKRSAEYNSNNGITYRGSRSSHHRSFGDSRISTISSSCPGRDGLGYSRASSSYPSNRGNNVRFSTCHGNEEIDQWNKCLSPRTQSSLQPSIRRDCIDMSRQNATRNDDDSSNWGSVTKDRYTHFDPKVTHHLPNHREDKPSSSAHSPRNTLINDADSQNPTVEQQLKEHLHSVDSFDFESNSVADSFKSRNKATLRGEMTANTINRVGNAGADSVISYSENSKGIYCEVRYRAKKSPKAKKVVVKEDKKPVKMWLCDVCKEARFGSYIEAFRHEIECKRIKAEMRESSSRGGEDNNSNDDQSSMPGTEQRALRRGKIKMQLREIELSSSSRPMRCNVVTRGSMQRESVGLTATKWLCSVCKKRSFDRYYDACRHEKICQRRKEATAVMTKPKDEHRYDDNQFVEDLRHNNMVARESRQENVCVAVYDNCTKGETCTSFGISHDRISQIRMEATADMTEQKSAWSFDDDVSFEEQRQNNIMVNGSRQRDVDIYIQDNRTNKACTTAETSHEKSFQTKTEATADMTEPKNELMYEGSHFVDKERRKIMSANESRQKNGAFCMQENSANVRYNIFETQKSNRTGYSHFGISHEIGEVFIDRYNAFKAIPEQDIKLSPLYNSKSRYEGDAYDRYISLASQAEDEEQREKYLALAKQTREEEMSCYRREENNEERYVCLA